MGKGIIGTLQLAATLAFAVPVAMFGADLLLSGQTAVGAAALVVAVLMVVLEEYLTTPGDVPGEVAQKAASTVVGTDDEEE
ncbi:MAG: hypothetical protein ABEJ23_00595 [Haloarculaceae archaeon]